MYQYQPRCSWCQKVMDGMLRAVASVYRLNHEEKNQIYFCNEVHAKLWKEGLGKRFVRWLRKPAI